MSKRTLVIFGVFAAVFGLLIPYLAISNDGEGGEVAKVPASLEHPKTLFQENCGACHTLAKAATDGIVGPDLDDLLATAEPEARKTRLQSAIEKGGTGGGRMPAAIVTGEDAELVADFVSKVAGE